ncbi:sugar phosphate isomerase/epimerase family protein [Cerasicoccus maritimus]|uniref:sugar phosphate isomerase/epimerase family protein n=1 Tax=Cerasicoccus maritimus TaxID=490089 RepID=UPI002852BF3F|nr:TIM barrel protein [Cerasicoccus maritimus]
MNYLKKPSYNFAGIGDEAGDPIEKQIQAIRELGWSHIELRSVNQKDITALGDADFEHVCRVLEGAEIKVCGVGSGIANWSRDAALDLQKDLKDAEVLIPRMQRLKAPYVRLMSYKIDGDATSLESLNAKLRIENLKVVCQLFLDAGITPLHENCFNYGGLGVAQTLELLEAIPGLGLIFDTGNPLLSPDLTQLGPPYPRQEAWKVWEQVRDYVRHVHIKDSVCYGELPTNFHFMATQYAYPGAGDADVARILNDLARRGYDGIVSIEPHIADVFHADVTDCEAAWEHKYQVFLNYGRRLMDLVQGAYP